MSSQPARTADTGKTPWRYERRRPECTLLYQIVAEHYPRFLELLADQGHSLPHYVQREFEDFLKCGILDHGFLRVPYVPWSRCPAAMGVSAGHIKPV